MTKNDKYPISMWTCSIRDSKIEREYFDNKMSIDKKYSRPLILIVGIIYLLLIIPQTILHEGFGDMMNGLFVRMISFLVILALYSLMSKEGNNTLIAILTSVVELILVANYFHTMMRIAGTEYYLAILDLVVMISMIFIIPNKFFYKLLVGVVAHIGFFIFAYYTIPDLSSNQFLTGMVYGTCIILIIVMTHHKINYFDRVKFLNEKELIILSETDALTGVYNRAKFDSELIKWIKLKKRYDHPISIVLMDFDNFKGVNDRFGHLRGDQILKDSAEIVRENTRETDVFARWGGEEFIILMPDTRRKNAIAIAERIRKSIEQHAFCIQDQVTCSFGVTEVYHNDTAYSVFDRVDELLYTAKSEGRNVVVS